MKMVVRLLGLVLLASIALGFDENRTSRGQGRLIMYGSGGQYADISRGCDGSVHSKRTVPFRELGANAEWRFPSEFTLRISTEIMSISDMEYDNTRSSGIVLSPRIGVHGEKAGFHFGFMTSTERMPGLNSRQLRPAFHLRIGRESTGHFDLHLFDEAPFISHGYFKLGLGWGPNEKGSFWTGISIAPFDRIGLLLRKGFRLSREVYLDFGLRLGVSEGLSENSISMGLGYHMRGKDRYRSQ